MQSLLDRNRSTVRTGRIKRQLGWAWYVPTDGRRQGASFGVAILVDTRTTKVESISSEQRDD